MSQSTDNIAVDKPVSYAVLDQSLWTRFQQSQSVGQFLESWLGLVTRQIDGLATGLLVTGEVQDVGPFATAAIWPTGGAPNDDLLEVAQQCIDGRQSIVLGEGTQRRLLAHPLIVMDSLFGAVVVSAPASAAPTTTLFRRLQWGAGWIELLLRREQEARDGELRERMAMAFDILATLLERPRLDEAASALVTELARRMDCETVSLGLRKGRRMKVQAVSSAASFGRRANLIKEVCLTMDEASDQEAVVLWPEPEGWDFRVSRAHEELARSHGVGSVLTIPLTSGNDIIGALTFERRAGASFSASDVEVCDAVASVTGPIIRDRQLASRWLPRRIWDSTKEMLVALLGPSHFGAKLATLVAVAALVFFWYARTDYDVTSTARIEGTVQRSLVAPFNGYLAGQSARAGDLVEEGEIIAVLDEKDLALERLRLATALSQRTRELERAIAEREIAEANIIRAQMDQAAAQLALVEEQLARTKIRAPFDGYVVEGDLSQNVGGSIERGQTLFKIAPLDSFRVVLEVDERDIDAIAEDQTGSLRLSAFPEQPLEYRVNTITPLARQGEGRNFFRVEAEPLGDSGALRPGMEGIARTAVAELPLFWVLTHNLADWARLAWWKWQP